jgi:hypothetical protein
LTTNRDALAHSLRIQFGTAPDEPTESQLDSIIDDMARISRPITQDWHDAVHRYCPSAGKYKYAGIDNSDLNELLRRAAQEARSQKR